MKSAEKAQDFIRLYKIKEYADYYKSIDKGYELPVEAKVFIKIQDELNINSINEAYAIIDNARDVRLELHQMKSSVLELQRQLNKLDTLKEEQISLRQNYLFIILNLVVIGLIMKILQMINGV